MAGTTSKESFFFRYKPSIAAVVIAVVVFGAITAAHIHRFIKTYKTTRMKLLVVLSMASFNEVLGYALRVPGADTKPANAIHSLGPLLLLFTPLMATSVIYCIFNKISTNIAPQSAPIKPSLMLKIWSAVDIVCQLTITAGAMIGSRSNPSTGKGILLAGIAIHIVNFVAFTAIVAIWHRRTDCKWTSGLIRPATPIQRDMLAMYVACGLIALRSLMRFVEFASGPDGPLQDHEAPFYFYEFVPMSFALVACLQWYDSENLRAVA
ncbi:hypothetical protein CC86DRAFT_471494 [Ophiobolus disseminans]|uniref:RTA1 like protein n=1 Tax=Ophiobolus disseminans TaxID=1469910 RepID=A0A6A6ZI83_9PLEO|nr:hypothetical protein CC86DRAFT_471494 [Ophiobolus disseminans]